MDNEENLPMEEALMLVGFHRRDTRHWFPFPDVASCIRYMVQEIGETDDALMRRDRPKDKRASDKETFVGLEIGQVAYMLLSACIANKEDRSIMPRTLNYLNITSGIIQSAIDEQFETAYTHICELADFANVDVEVALAAAMDNIDARKK